MEINIVDKDGFTNYCGSIIQNSEWEKELKEAHEAFKKEPTIQKYLEIKDKIASLRNRSFYNDEVKLLTENKAQERLNKFIKNIKEEEDIDRLKNLYGNKDKRDTLVGALYEILKDSSSFPWAECNRIFIALHPNLFCAIPFEANVNKLIALLEEKKYIKVTKSNQDLWIDKAHAVSNLFKNAGYEIKIGSDNENTNVTLPWQVFDALGGRTSDHGELLKNNRNLILTGAPGTGKTYKDGIKSVPGLKSYIGKDVNSSIEQITKDWSFIKVCDCIGLSGYRNITMMKVERRIEIICETENREEIINDSIAPSGVKWVIMDIFNYWYRPEKGKGFY
jgi:hypothetical protein